MVFFLNADEKVYARYGGRDATSPDARQSLEGLRYTMQSVLAMHGSAEKVFAPRSADAPRFMRDVAGMRFRRGCLHCHQVKEVLNTDLQNKGQWTRDSVWRYPLPENLGLTLDVDRGNVVKQVVAKSPAAAVGLEPRDVLQRLNGVPVHSFADGQFALDKAPRAGAVPITWYRAGTMHEGRLILPEGWRKTDLSWRPSMQRLIPAARLFGDDLTPEEKKALGLPPQQLAFRQKDPVSSQAEAAGIRPGDIILGIDNQPPGMDLLDFLRYVRRSFLVGDQVTVNLVRDGKRLKLPMTLRR
jgi:S1-C subfamily serine protease